MKVLFISSGNKKEGISPIVHNQGEYLKKQGIDLEYYTIVGKGWMGYFKHVFSLAGKIRKGRYDILHAHYSLSGFLVTLASPFKSSIVVSLMGTIKKGTLKYRLIHLLYKYRWKSIIVKSERMKQQVNLTDVLVIPNGVFLAKFDNGKSRAELKEEIGINSKDRIVIFVSNPERKEKNFKLCQDSVKLLNDANVVLIPVFNLTHDEVAKYMLAADVLMLTSFTEGSPNVIKEAMAAGCPIVTTNVGDVDYLLKNLAGTYIMNSFDPKEGVELLRNALNFEGRTNGLKRLKELKLSAEEVSHKIIDVYNRGINSSNSQ